MSTIANKPGPSFFRGAAVVTSVLLSAVTAGCMRMSHSDEVQTEVNLRTMSMALQLHQQAQGRFPSEREGLSALVGQYLADEHSLDDAWGHRAVYRHIEGMEGPVETFLLYSTGANGVDEGGRGDDIVARSNAR